MCCTRLAANTGRKKVAKNRHLDTIAQLCRAISSKLRHISTIGKKLVKQQYLLHMSLQYGELRPTSGWDHFVSLRHPCKYQRVLRLGSVTARHSSSGRQPNVAALNRGRHLYSAGRPSRWALAHISSSFVRYNTMHCIYVRPKANLPHVKDTSSINSIQKYDPHYSTQSAILFSDRQLHARNNIIYLWPPYWIGQAIIFSSCGFLLSICLLFSSPNLIGRTLDVYHTSTHGVALVRI